jgi:hypothetical protein
MPDLNGVTTFINSPPGQLVAGATLAGIVWKFFDKIEGVLSDQTKFEIAVWLVGVKTAEKVGAWADSVYVLFQKMFGELFSWRRLIGTLVTSLIGFVIIGGAMVLDLSGDDIDLLSSLGFWKYVPFLASRLISIYFPLGLFFSAIPIFMIILVTQFALKIIRDVNGSLLRIFLLMGHFIVTFLLASFPAVYVSVHAYHGINFWQTWDAPVKLLGEAQFYQDVSSVGDIIHWYPTLFRNMFRLNIPKVGEPFFYANIVPLAWIWLYVGSGFLLTISRRFDIGFAWFNRKFDIEKHPLNAIGLVAGSLVALLYWAWATFRHFHGT